MLTFDFSGTFTIVLDNIPLYAMSGPLRPGFNLLKPIDTLFFNAGLTEQVSPWHFESRVDK